MDALNLLTADHNRVRGLFTRFQTAEEEQDTAQMAVLAQKIITELEVHTTIEEEIFYPAVKDASEELKDVVDEGVEEIFYPAVKDASEELKEVVDEGVEEHHVADTLMAEIKTLTPEDDAWAAKMKVLIESVEHHAEEEEQEMFPPTRKALDKTALEELGMRLEARKAELGAPTTADKEHLSTEELKELAKEQEIPGRSSMDREELLATVDPA